MTYTDEDLKEDIINTVKLLGWTFIPLAMFTLVFWFISG